MANITKSEVIKDDLIDSLHNDKKYRLQEIETLLEKIKRPEYQLGSAEQGDDFIEIREKLDRIESLARTQGDINHHFDTRPLNWYE